VGISDETLRNSVSRDEITGNTKMRFEILSDMRRQGILTTERGVSSVVAVLLMVAVTVILATTVGVFVFDIGSESTTTSPQIGWEYDFNGGDVEATFINGDAVEATYLTAKGDCSVSSISYAGTVDGGTTIQIGTGCDPSGETLRIVWDSPESDQSAIIGRFSN